MVSPIWSSQPSPNAASESVQVADPDSLQPDVLNSRGPMDIHNSSFLRSPYAFDNPTPENMQRVKEGMRKVENTSIGNVVDYIQEMLSNAPS